MPSYKRTRLIAVLAAMPAVALLLSGCQNVTGFSSPSLVRVIDASYNAPAIDVYAGKDGIATNVGHGSITNYAQITPSTRTVTSYSTGTKTEVSTATGTFLSTQQHSAFITDYNSTYQTTVLVDQSTPAPSGQFSIRFLQQAPASGPVDIYLIPDGTKFTDAKPIVTALAPGQATGYVDYPVGTLDLVVVPTGTTTPKYTSAAITFVTGQVRTMLLVDQQLLTNPPIQVIIGNDLN